MDVMYMTCKKCDGHGYTGERMVKNNEWGTVKECSVCDVCNGTGNAPYVLFSMEEAKVIMKHCGLITES